MRKKMRTILRDSLMHQKRYMICYITIVFLCGVFLTVTFLSSDSESIENTLANSLDYSLSYTDNSYFSKESPDSSYISNPDLNREMTDMFIRDLEDLCNDKNLEYANYALAINSVINHGTEMYSQKLYGLRNTEYFERNHISLDGCRSKNLVKDTVVLPVEYREKGIQINDVYAVVDPLAKEKTVCELKVIGFYQEEDWEMSNSDPLIADQPLITTKETILNILNAVPAYYGYYEEQEMGILIPKLEISNMSFTPENIRYYNAFAEKFDAFSLQENRKFSKMESEKGGSSKLGLQTDVNTFGSLLKSIQRVKYMYQFTFIGIWILLLVSMFGFISYLQKKNQKDIVIRNGMGEKIGKTVSFYVKYYVYPVLVVLLVANICGFVLTGMINQYLSFTSLRFQNLMMNDTNVALQKINLFAMKFSWKTLFAFCATDICIILAIIIAVSVSVFQMRKANALRQLRG